MNELKRAARRLNDANVAYERAFSGWFRQQPACGADRAAEILRQFCILLTRYQRRESQVELAAWELFRPTLCQDAGSFAAQDLVGFVRWYQDMKSQAERDSEYLFEFSGDAHGDLADSIVLAGPEGLRVLQGQECDDVTALRSKITELCGSLVGGMVGKENYLLSRLREACQKYIQLAD